MYLWLLKWRCPTYVRLHQTEKGSQEYAVFADEASFSLEKSDKMLDFNKVCEEIERRTEIIAGNSKNVSRVEICIDIYSPNYPGLYPNNINCRWHIKAEKEFGIELQIKESELEEK